MSTSLRRLAATAVTGIAGVSAMLVAVTGLPQAMADGSTAGSLAALKATSDAAVHSVEAHGRNAEGYEGDEAPAGVDVHDAVPTSELIEAAATIPDPGTPAGNGSRISTGCSEDGTSGNRVQVVYVVASDKPDRYNDVVGAIRQYSAGVDAIFLASAAEHGGRRQVRWVHDASCQPVIARAVVSPTSTGSLSAMQSALAAQGFNRGDRKYLIYADASVLCGVANVYTDTSPLQTNANNGGYAQYARVDTPCWGASEHSVPAHELTHTLGAVLSFAPHASAAGHCTDESDLMCYQDGSNVVMTQSCPTTHEKLLDCNGDDYFNVNPAPGSALASNWNSANSSFLYDPPAPVIAGSGFDAGTVSVQPRVLSGQGWRIDWSGAGCTVASARTDSASPTGASVPVTCPAGGTVTALLTQQDGRSVSTTVTTTATPAPAPAVPAPATAPVPAPSTPAAAVPAPAAPTAPVVSVLTLGASPTTVAAGGRTVLSGTVKANGAPVAGQRVDLQRKLGGWARVGTAWTSTLGTVSFPQTVSATSAYRLVLVRTGAVSATVTVTTTAPRVKVTAKGRQLRGTVTPVSRGALVTLRQGTRTVDSARTDARGVFALTLPRAGTNYSITVAAPGTTVSTAISLRAALR